MPSRKFECFRLNMPTSEEEAQIPLLGWSVLKPSRQPFYAVFNDGGFVEARPLGGGRPVSVNRTRRRTTTLRHLLGIARPIRTRGGEGVELQLRARHSKFSFTALWLISLFSLRGRNWPVVLILLYTLYVAALVASLMAYYAEEDIDEEDRHAYLKDFEVPVNTLGVALFFLLGFRTDNSYARWWNARLHWSVIQSRAFNCAREVVAYIDNMDMRHGFLRWLIALLVAMKAHLRDDRDVSELDKERILYVSEFQWLERQPDMVAHCFVQLSDRVYDTMNKNYTRQPQLIVQMARDNLRHMAESFFSADGIRVTPMPYAYVVHLRCCLSIWLMALPLAYTYYFGWWTIPAAAVIGIALLGFDSIATAIECPYGCDYNCIPMDAITERMRDLLLHFVDIRTHGAKPTDVSSSTTARKIHKTDSAHESVESAKVVE